MAAAENLRCCTAKKSRKIRYGRSYGRRGVSCALKRSPTAPRTSIWNNEDNIWVKSYINPVITDFYLWFTKLAMRNLFRKEWRHSKFANHCRCDPNGKLFLILWNAEKQLGNISILKKVYQYLLVKGIGVACKGPTCWSHEEPLLISHPNLGEIHMKHHLF